MFTHDKPINKLTDDILGRANFSKEIAKSLTIENYSESMVIAIYGEWGSGKSSVINMIRDECENNYKEKIKVISFNPWFYSDRHNLILKFFERIASEEEIFNDIRKKKKIYSTISEYAANFESVPYISMGMKPLKSITDSIRKNYENKLTIENQQRKIKELFSNLKYKLLIIIDDIDRLTGSEVRDIFQLVKLVADIPNILYLLAFDREVVRFALEDFHKGKGEEYLEKIVQVQFEIPQLQKKDLEEFLFKRIDEIIKDEPQEEFDIERWNEVYQEGMKYLFSTLRHINRYINTLSFDYNLVKGEINIVDFLVITALKVFNPDLYSTIKNNKFIFLDSYKSQELSFLSEEQKTDKFKTSFNQIIKENEIESFLKEMIINLFPKAYSALGDGYYNKITTDYTTDRKKRRICNEDYFDTYFILSLDKDSISNKEFKAILGEKDVIIFKELLKKINEEKKINNFLEKLEDSTENILDDEYEKIINVLLDIGDVFLDNLLTYFADSNHFKILRIINKLLMKINDRKKRYSLLKNAILNAKESLYAPILEIAVRDQEYGRFNYQKKNNNKEILIDESDLDELEQIGKKKIEDWWKEKKLIYAKYFLHILYRWEEWGGRENLEKFVNENCMNNDSMLILLERFLERISHQSSKGYEKSSSYKINYDDAKRLLDIDLIYNKLLKITDEELIQYSIMQREAVALFKKHYEGKNIL